MTELSCKNCNAPLDMTEAKNGVIACSFCGSVFTLPKSGQTDEVKRLIDAGKTALDVCRFDDAFASYSKAVELDGSEPEAYWGRAQARSRVQYLKDTVNNRLQPICHEVTGDRFIDDPDYKKALELATEEQRSEYVKKAEEIDYIRSEFFKLKESGLEYDCFICVKVTGDNGGHTEDSFAAMRLYNALKKSGYKAFFSEEEMGSRTGADYEALILYALKSSPCMLIVCFDKKYLETKWVKNEYTRYISMIAEEEHERDGITIVYRSKPVEKLPGIKGKIQGIDFNSFDAIERIKQFIDSHDEVKKRAAKAELEESARAELYAREKAERERAAIADERLKAAEQLAAEMERRLKEMERLTAEKSRAQTPAQAPAQTSAPAKAQTEAADWADKIPVSPAEDFVIENGTLVRYGGEEKQVSVPAGITRIGVGAFNAGYSSGGSGRMVEAVIPEGVTAIGDKAFLNCANLRRIKLPSSLKELGGHAFDGCAQLEEIILPDGLQKIGSYAFDGCTSLAETKIPSSVTSVGMGAFNGCSNLTIICKSASAAGWGYNWHGGRTVITQTQPASSGEFDIRGGVLFGYKGKGGAVTVPDGVTAVGDSAFSGNKAVTAIVLPYGVKKIGCSAFEGAAALKEVVLPATLVEIGNSAFAGTAITGINLPDGLRTVGQMCFSQSRLKSIRLPYGVTDVEGGVFGECAQLEEVVLSPVTGVIGTLAFSGCCALKDLTIPDSVTDIQRNAFAKSGLAAVVVPSGVTKIGPNAFAGCAELRSVRLERGVEIIGSSAFSDCKTLASLILPDGLKVIGGSAFAGCSSLKEISVPASVEAIGVKAFDGCGGTVVCREQEDPSDWLLGWNGDCKVRREPDIRAEDFEIRDGVLCGYRGEGGAVTVPLGVREIDGFDLSKSFSEITLLSVPSSVERIGGCAFFGCKALKKVRFTGGMTAVSLKEIGVQAFEQCEALETFEFPPSVNKIGNRAFFGCEALTTAVLPRTLQAVGSEAFAYCKALSRVQLPDSFKTSENDIFGRYRPKQIVYTAAVKPTAPQKPVEVPKPQQTAPQKPVAASKPQQTVPQKPVEVPKPQQTVPQKPVEVPKPQQTAPKHEVSTQQDFEIANGVLIKYKGKGGQVTVPTGIVTIGENAFDGCAALKSIVIPDSVTTIGANAFGGCDALTSIVIPDSVTTIGANAFGGCDALTSIVIPDSVTTIGENAFDGCAALKSIVIPDSVTTIGRNAFGGCRALTSIVIPDSVTTIGAEAFSGCEALEKVILSDSVTEIAESAFAGCARLKEIKLPSAAVRIGEKAFFGCAALGKVVLPDALETVAPETFAGCKSLREIRIPDGCKTIGQKAFADCQSLVRADLPGTLERIGESAFAGCAAPEYFLPAGLKSIAASVFRSGVVKVTVHVPRKKPFLSQPEGWDKNWAGEGVKVKWNK